MNMTPRSLIALAILAATSWPALAQIKIGVTLSTTGPAVSLGIPEKNTIALLPKTIGGKSVEYIVLDDASDSSAAVVNTRRLTLEDKVDAIIGSTTTPNSLAMTDAVAESGTPTISLASSARIIEPMSPKKAWVFKTPQTDTMMVLAILEHAAKRGIKSMGYIGFNDALGEAFYAEFEKFASVRGIKIVANERFAPRDTSVTSQVLKLSAANPEMVVIGASGTPAVLPARALVERGYKGSVYFNHGVANNDFLRVGGKDIEGAFVPTSPVVVAASLPVDHPAKAQAMAYVKAYEAVNGAGSVSAFGAYTWDAGLLLAHAIPVALKTAQPGSKEFRTALRDALEATRDLKVSNGVTSMSKNDHLGLDQRARVVVKVEGGKWKLD
ncbi:ABC transporter substrate-binding protein [Rhizobacter sp. Root404]|uniref:ABC transporter substrate-binding protein n=1 Tax=Rhizobacter sp. Root404 TaxID=1736528 RepID=UPI000700BC37|nr:ABC transporter substrate-binding protein [Rhizobacter sp. Root404]KQW37858.1 branched-chain amino acid ABC transporter substrate-binding protein [Rhizobacter sp. Root404]